MLVNILSVSIKKIVRCSFSLLILSEYYFLKKKKKKSQLFLPLNFRAVKMTLLILGESTDHPPEV
jgi:hypothetical protein